MSDSDYAENDEKIVKMEKTLHKYSIYISELQTLIEQLQTNQKNQQDELLSIKAKNQELEDVNKHHLQTIRKLQIKLINPPEQQEMELEPNATQPQEEFPPLRSKKKQKKASITSHKRPFIAPETKTNSSIRQQNCK